MVDRRGGLVGRWGGRWGVVWLTAGGVVWLAGGVWFEAEDGCQPGSPAIAKADGMFDKNVAPSSCICCLVQIHDMLFEFLVDALCIVFVVDSYCECVWQCYVFVSPFCRSRYFLFAVSNILEWN